MNETLGQFGYFALCVMGSAFAAAAETALTAITGAKTRQLIDEGGHTSLELWAQHPDRVLATLLILNTFTISLSSAIMTGLVHSLGAPNAIALATGASTVIVIAFGEVTPKSLARQNAVFFAPLAMPLVRLLYWPLYPFVSVLEYAPRLVQMLFRRTPGEKPPDLTGAELEYMIEYGVSQGVLDRDKSELLRSVLDFTDIVSREIMIPRLNVVGVPIGASREELLKIVLDSEHSRFPVYDGSIDDVVGIFHVKTFLADLEMGRLIEPFDLKRYCKEPFFVPELMKISRLLREFQKRKTHLAVVVDEFGGTSGVVALEDVVEQLVGEIHDETDVDEGRVKVMQDGTVIADAAVALRELEPHLKVDFPDELDADSLGGFVVATAGKVPPVGSVVVWEGLRFTVRAADERRVTRVEITKDRKAERVAGGVPDKSPPASAKMAPGGEEGAVAVNPEEPSRRPAP